MRQADSFIAARLKRKINYLKRSYGLRKMKTAVQRAIMASMVGKKPLSRAGINFFSPNQRKNRIVNQSAIADMSMDFSPLLKLIFGFIVYHQNLYR